MRLTLETKRLLLRPWEVSDAQAMFDNWANDPEVTKHLTWTPHKDVSVTKAKLEEWVSRYDQPERIKFAIVLKEENKLIGDIGVVGYLEDGMPVIGYASSRAYWGHGYMTEACMKVLELLKSLGHKVARIDAEIDNIGSNRVIQKCGGVFYELGLEDWPNRNEPVQVNRYLVDLTK